MHIRFHIFRNEMHGMVISRSTESDDLHICSHVSGNDGLHLGLHIFRKVTICICVFQFSKKMKVLILYFHISRKLQNYKCGFANFRNDECHMCCRVLLKVINSICFCGIFGAWRDAYVISHFQKVINCTCVFTFFWKRRITNLFSHFSEHHEMHICFRTSLESDESYICFRIFQNIIKCICVFAIFGNWWMASMFSHFLAGDKWHRCFLNFPRIADSIFVSRPWRWTKIVVSCDHSYRKSWLFAMCTVVVFWISVVWS